MYIAPINQLRSALDHIFKAVNSEEQSEYELKEAKEHLDRAGYDALELLAANLGEQIIKKLNGYSANTIATIFPTYYSEIKPKLTDIKQVVAHLRTEKKISAEKTFSAYFDQITELIDMDKTIDRFIPSLAEYEQKVSNEQKKKDRRQVYINIVIAVVSASIPLLLTWIF